MEIDFLNKRIVQQCEYICNTFARYDRGEISEKRCRELVDSAVGVRDRLKSHIYDTPRFRELSKEDLPKI